MLTYKQRYKPRTEREYTKTDLTVYDSAGNTALNALTVYGKSEVIDGAIVSAGEGWSTVDLGTLNWNYDEIFYSVGLANKVKTTPNDQIANLLINRYTAVSRNTLINEAINNAIAINTGGTLQIRDTAYTNPTVFKTAMSGVLLCYELADPTQGNTIAVKTDNGTGINGTMAVFETGTPLYGVSDTVRDVMTWDRSSGEVTKNCNKANASDLTWTWIGQYQIWRTISLNNLIKPSAQNVLQSFMVTPLEYTGVSWEAFGSTDKTYSVSPSGTIGFKDSNYDSTKTPDFEFLYELATPTTTPLTQTENESIASLRAFANTTHFTNNTDTDITVNYTMRVPTIS